MLLSSQRIGIRYCLSLSGAGIDAKQDSDLEGTCQACRASVSRQFSSQLFQHSSHQCKNIVLSEITERLSTLLKRAPQISLPLGIRSSNSIEQTIVDCASIISPKNHPLLKLVLEDNQVIYLTIKLEDSQLPSEQLSSLKKQNYSVIEIDLSDLTMPSSNLTFYLEEKAINKSFYKRCFWLSFNPLDSLARNISNIEYASIERNRRRALQELSLAEEQRDIASKALDSINSLARIADEKLERSQELLKRIDINKSTDYLLKKETELKSNVETLRIQKSKLLQNNTEDKLTQKIENLRGTYREGKYHVEKQEKNNQKLKREIEEKVIEINSMKREIKRANWMHQILAKLGFEYREFQEEIKQIELIFDSYDKYERKLSIVQNSYELITNNIIKKEKDLLQLKKAIDFYTKEKFRLFKEFNTLKKEVLSKEPK